MHSYKAQNNIGSDKNKSPIYCNIVCTTAICTYNNTHLPNTTSTDLLDGPHTSTHLILPSGDTREDLLLFLWTKA